MQNWIQLLSELNSNSLKVTLFYLIMKRGVILLLLLLVFSSFSYAEVIDISETSSEDQLRDEIGTKKFIYVGDGIVASVEGSSVKYYHGDRLSNRLTTDSSGNRDKEFKSLPFGQSVFNSGVENPFTGKEEDESSLYYFGARYYDDNLGRFSGVDPVAENHAYSYVANNPMNYIDPTGMRLEVSAGTRVFYPPRLDLGELAKSYSGDPYFVGACREFSCGYTNQAGYGASAFFGSTINPALHSAAVNFGGSRDESGSIGGAIDYGYGGSYDLTLEGGISGRYAGGRINVPFIGESSAFLEAAGFNYNTPLTANLLLRGHANIGSIYVGEMGVEEESTVSGTINANHQTGYVLWGVQANRGGPWGTTVSVSYPFGYQATRTTYSGYSLSGEILGESWSVPSDQIGYLVNTLKGNGILHDFSSNSIGGYFPRIGVTSPDYRGLSASAEWDPNTHSGGLFLNYEF